MTELLKPFYREGREACEDIFKAFQAVQNIFAISFSFATSPALHQTQCGASVVSSR
jgi:hypothetical protein